MGDLWQAIKRLALECLAANEQSDDLSSKALGWVVRVITLSGFGTFALGLSGSLNLTDIVVADVDSANVTVTLTLSNTAAGALSTATSNAVTSTFGIFSGNQNTLRIVNETANWARLIRELGIKLEE